MFPMRPDSVAADSALTVTTLNPAISSKNPSILRLFINVLARSLARLNLFFDLACLCTSIVHQPLVRLNFFQHRNKTIRISNSVRFEFILDLIQTLRNAQTLELDGVIDVETDRLLIDQSIEKSRQLHHFLSVREIEDGFFFPKAVLWSGACGPNRQPSGWIHTFRLVPDSSSPPALP